MLTRTRFVTMALVGLGTLVFAGPPPALGAAADPYQDRGAIFDERGDRVDEREAGDRLGQDRSADEDQNEDIPDPGTAARVRFLRGNVGIERATDNGLEQATLNTPVFEGDEVRTDDGGLAEVQLADGSMVRLAAGTSAEFRTLVDPYGKLSDSNVIRLSSGSLYIDATTGTRSDDRDALVQVDTPSASVYVQGPGLYRIDSNDVTRVTAPSPRADAEVVGDRGSVFLHGGQRTEVAEDEAPDRPFAVSPRPEDDFDRWNQQRIALASRAGSSERSYNRQAEDNVDYERIPDEVRPYAGELSAYGRWTVVPDYGYVWSPYDVGSGWRPYYDGRWVYGPYGWYWCSYDPWGWAPYHFGRWSFATSIGWVWIPGHVFSGAWVSWYYGPSYIGWCPLDFYDRPAFVHVSFTFGGFGCDPRVWSFVPYNRIVVRNVNTVIINNINVTQLNQGVIVRKAVAIRPQAIARNTVIRNRVLEQARRRAEIERAVVRSATPGRAPALKGVVKPGQSFRDEERVAIERIRRGDPQRIREARLRQVERLKAEPPSGAGTVIERRRGAQPRRDLRPGAATEATPWTRREAQPRERGARPEAGQPRTHPRAPQGREPETGGEERRREARPETRQPEARPDSRAPQGRERAVERPQGRRPGAPADRQPRTHPRRREAALTDREVAARDRDRQETSLRGAPDPRRNRDPEGDRAARAEDFRRFAPPSSTSSSDERLRRLFRDADRPRTAPRGVERDRTIEDRRLDDRRLDGGRLEERRLGDERQMREMRQRPGPPPAYRAEPGRREAHPPARDTREQRSEGHSRREKKN